MKLKTYNQLLDKYSRMGCIRYGIGHIMLFKYGLFTTNNYLLKSLAVFENIGMRSLIFGAEFGPFYKSYVGEVNKKLGIKLKDVTKSVHDLKKDDTGTWGLGIIEYHSFGQLISDGEFSQDEIDQFMKKDGVGHHITWDGSKGGYLINSNGSKPIKCTLQTLKLMATKGMIRDNVRTLEPVGMKTAEILHQTLYMMKAEQKGKLDKYLETNKEHIYLDKIKKLYYYGRK